MTQKKADNKKKKFEKRSEKEELILAELIEKAKNPNPKILALQERIYKRVSKFVPSKVSLADELVQDRKKEEI